MRFLKAIICGVFGCGLTVVLASLVFRFFGLTLFEAMAILEQAGAMSGEGSKAYILAVNCAVVFGIISAGAASGWVHKRISS